MPPRRTYTRKKVKVEYEDENDQSNNQTADSSAELKSEAIDFDSFKFDPNSSIKQSDEVKQSESSVDTKSEVVDESIKHSTDESKTTEGDIENAGPPHWREVFNLIMQMRSTRDAPVDMTGCDRAGDETRDPKIQRFRVLVSLMLSAQTKDAVTHAAIQALNARWNDGLTIQNIQSIDQAELDALIHKVGFHTRKAEFIKRTADILANHFEYDIPDSIESLCSLPGVGPKMAHLAMNSAWQRVMGIGVDVHVHRIANRLGWVSTREAEETREDLQAFVPYSMWNSINKILVGFGQQICLPRGPKCTECLVSHLCPVGKVNVERISKGLSPINPTKEQARAAVKPTKRKRTHYAKFDESTPSPRLKKEAREAGVSVEEEQTAEAMESRAEALENDTDTASSSSTNQSTNHSLSSTADELAPRSRSGRSRKINYKE